MLFLRALLFAFGIFVVLTIISLFVASIMTLIYKLVHRSKKEVIKDAEIQPGSSEKAG